MRVVSADDAGVRLAAPLAPNVNHCGTAFGGSASAVAILSAWVLVHTRLAAAGIPGQVVIQRNSVEYLRPIRGDFEAFCGVPTERAWERFLTALTTRGRGRIRLAAELRAAGEVAGTFRGEYVALQ